MTRKIDKDRLYELYVVEKHSMKEVSTILECGVGTIHRHIRKLLIDARPTGLNRDGTCWNKGKTYKDDDRILAKEKHPRYIDGRTYTSDFRHLHEILLPSKCALCPAEATLLHHRDKNKDNNVIDNLVPLCSSCHTGLHNKGQGRHIAMLKARGYEFINGKFFKMPN